MLYINQVLTIEITNYSSTNLSKKSYFTKQKLLHKHPLYKNHKN